MKSSVGARFGAPTKILVSLIAGAILAVCPLLAESKPSDGDERSIKLITKLAHTPHLISYDYLKCALGAPSRVSCLPGGIARQAEWFDMGTNHLRYRYQQEFGPLIASGSVRNHFEFFLNRGTSLTTKGLARRLNSSCTTQYDQHANPTGFYKVSPNMTLEAHELGSDRTIGEISLDYVGPGLPAPSASEYTDALQVRRDEAFAQFGKGYRSKAAPLLSSYLKDFPSDPEAHLKLAEAYKAGGCINQAINQYSLVYALSETDPHMRQEAERGLQALKLGPIRQANVAQASPPSGNQLKSRRTPADLQNNPDYDPFKIELVDWKVTPRSKSIASSARALDVGF
jgi:hypothetical protein